LSTSEDRNVALLFVDTSGRDNNRVSVILQMNMDTNFKNVKPYANISQLSCFTDENEILFMLASVYFVLLVLISMVKTIYGYYHLDISSENDQEYKNVFEHESREVVGDKPNLLSSWRITLSYWSL
jgi:hypothetical protein